MVMTQEKVAAANIAMIIMIIVAFSSPDCECSFFPKGELLTLSCSGIVMDRSLNAWPFCLSSVVILGFEAFQVL